MTELPLPLQIEHIPAFIDEAQRVLRSRRADTAFGKDASRHRIYTALNAGADTFPVVVVLQVRSRKKKKGGYDTRLALTEVRPPEGNEIIDGNLAASAPPWPNGFEAAAWRAVVGLLRQAASAVTAPPPVTLFRRGYLAFFGARMSGEYRGAGWRLSAPHFPEDPKVPASLLSEQMAACDRDVGGTDSNNVWSTFASALEQLALLLTVFWCTRVYATHYSEYRWVHENIDGKLTPRLRHLGFSEPEMVRPQRMLPPGALPPGPTRAIDRLDPREYGTRGDRFEPPDDAMGLLDLFAEASHTMPLVTEPFLSAAKAYQISDFLYHPTPTGALAYLVVAAESLVEEELPNCHACRSKVGVSSAVQQLILRELPCLRDREAEIRRMLGEVYEIRSKHFHTGRFAGGELEPWRSSNILLPSRQAIRRILQRMNAVVNSLLVAWLVRRVTGTTWSRASEPMPEWHDEQMLATTVHIGG